MISPAESVVNWLTLEQFKESAYGHTFNTVCGQILRGLNFMDDQNLVLSEECHVHIHSLKVDL